MKQSLWFGRKFSQIDDNGLLPNILIRLESTPIFLHERLKDFNEPLSEIKLKGKWSIKEEIGHLIDLEDLWSDRIRDFIGRKKILRAADLTNRKTHEANHNIRLVNELIREFQLDRSRLLEQLYSLSSQDLQFTSLHPRLKSPMRIIDLAYFIAEHDCHHLAKINHIMKTVEI